MEKIYCYVDETGQHTYGNVFAVSVIMAKEDRDTLGALLERIESQTGKKATKWMKSKQSIKQSYMRVVIKEPAFVGRAFYSFSTDTKDYRPITLSTIASAITTFHSSTEYKASIYIDGLSRPEYRAVGTGLHRIGVTTEKVRGVTDESSPFIRLADAVAGLVREQKEGRLYAAELCEQARRSGFLRKV